MEDNRVGLRCGRIPLEIFVALDNNQSVLSDVTQSI